MTQEERLYLSSFEKNFDTAINHQYSAAIPVKDLKKMLEILKKYEPGYTANLNCSRCILGLLQKIGKLFKDSVITGTEPEEEVPETETLTETEEKPVADKVKRTKRTKQ